jgi:hypothetical protein
MRTNKELDDAIEELKRPDKVGLFGKIISLIVWAVAGFFAILFALIQSVWWLAILPIGLVSIFVPGGLVIAAVIIALLIGYSVNKMIWSGGREDNKRKKYIRRFKEMKKRD